MSVVGFDDAPLALSTDPPLSTVHQSPEQMGREMVDLMLKTMSLGDAPQPGGSSRRTSWSAAAPETRLVRGRPCP